MIPNFTGAYTQQVSKPTGIAEMLSKTGQTIGSGLKSYGMQKQKMDLLDAEKQEEAQLKQASLLFGRIIDQADDAEALAIFDQAYKNGAFDDDDRADFLNRDGSVDRGAMADFVISSGYPDILPASYRSASITSPTTNKTIAYKNGTYQAIMNDSSRRVFDAQNNELFGPAAEEALKAGVQSGVQFEGDKARVTTEQKENAKANVALRTQPEIEAAIQKARKKAEREEETNKDLKTYNQVKNQLDRFDTFVEEGVYTGNILDEAIQAGANFGIVFDQNKLNNTTRIRQIATNLKFMAKPPGMGGMSDGEWKIIQDAIPDPDSATVEQLKAGIDEFRIGLANRAGISTQNTSMSSEEQSRIKALENRFGIE